MATSFSVRGVNDGKDWHCPICGVELGAVATASVSSFDNIPDNMRYEMQLPATCQTKFECEIRTRVLIAQKRKSPGG